MFRWRLPPQSWIRSALVRRLFLLVSLFAAFAITGIVHADEVPAPELAFDELVRQGDLARFAGRSSDAVRAYARALKLRNDPRIEGRLGLVALAGGAPAQAAPHLLRAIVDGHTIAPGERQQIKAAFDRARPLVSRIGVKISHVGAHVTIDGKLESMATTAADFYVFRAPGHHEFRATLEGFEDAVVAIDTKKGDSVEVSLVLTPLPSVSLNESPTEPEPTPAAKCKQKEDWASVEPPQKPSAKELEDAENNRVRGQWMPGIGGTATYGAVSPYLATGFIVSSYWKLNTVFSTGFDFRAVMSERGIENYEILGASFALLPAFCVTRAFFTGCLTGHGGILWHSSNNPEVSKVRPSWGGGVNLGFTFARYAPIDFRATLYGELLRNEYPLRTGLLGRTLWTGPQFMTGLSLTAVLNR